MAVSSTMRRFPWFPGLAAALALAAMPGCHKVNRVPWTPALQVSGVSPPRGPVQGGTVVIVNGMEFQTGAVVAFGGVAAASPTVLDSRRLLCITPASGGPGPADVVVRNPGGGSAEASDAFEFTTWLDTNLPRRVPVDVSGGAAGALTAWQVRVVLPFDQEMESDFSDVRFSVLDAGTETAIPHWVESAVAGTEAVFWVRVPSVPAAPGAARLYAYYGNPALAVAPDFDATFAKDLGEPGLVGLWHCDEGAGADAGDASGAGNHLVLHNFSSPYGWLTADGGGWGSTGAPTFSSGSSFRFDGVDDFLSCPGNATLDLVSALSAEAWVRGDDSTVSGRERVILAKWRTSANPGFTGTWAAAAPPSAQGGYCGAVFDGRYILLVPFENASGKHGEFLRYDTRAPFTAAGGGWTVFDPGTAGLGTGLRGYAGAAFDGRYAYFPNASGDGRVLRFDTLGDFQALASWTAYNPGAHGVGADPRGYFGAVFDGRYVTFAPYENESGPHGEVLRYDTAGAFTSASSWAAVNPGALCVNSDSRSDPRGYCGAVFDGTYIFFVPHARAYPAGQHAEVLRYDTRGDFQSLSSWASYDPSWGGVGTAARGYAGAVAVGQYVYFTPEYNGSTYHHEVLRLDRLGTFATAGAWSAFSCSSVGSNPNGFAGAASDGRYVYFVPCFNGSAYHGEVLQFDCCNISGFASNASWAAHDPGNDVLGYALNGFRGAVFDGRFLYLVPARTAEIARYDAFGGDVSWKLCAGVAGQDGGFSSAPFGISATINTPVGAFSVSANRRHEAGRWIHAVVTYDGADLKLYVNGVMVSAREAPGTVQISPASLHFGAVGTSKDRISKFWGQADEARLYGRALPAGEILAHAQRRKWTDPEPAASVAGVEERR